MVLPNAGFLVVHTFEDAYEEYCSRFDKLYPDHWSFTGTLLYSIPHRRVASSEVRKKYRGTDRTPLIAWPSEKFPDETWMAREQPEAAQALDNLEVSKRAEEGFIFSLQDARLAYSLLRNPEKWEVILAGNSDVAVDKSGVGITLGFEPTWFVGDHFSAVCDCMCFPKWHGTDEDGTLFADHYERLNQHGLFGSRNEAQQFLQFYRSFNWTETGDYVIAEICLPE